MSDSTIKILAPELSVAMQEYYRNFKGKQRLGQFLCNKFNIADDRLFYTESDKEAINQFVTYID